MILEYIAYVDPCIKVEKWYRNFCVVPFGIDVSNGARNPRWVNVYRNRTHALETLQFLACTHDKRLRFGQRSVSRYMPSNAFWLLRRFLDSVSWNKSKNGRPAYQFFPSNVDARKKLYRSARTRKWRAKIDRFNIEKSRIEWAKLFSLSRSNGTSIDTEKHPILENYISFGRK